jgi:hypothetical protein
VPVRIHPVRRDRYPQQFLQLLVGANKQRIKGADVLMAEAAAQLRKTFDLSRTAGGCYA